MKRAEWTKGMKNHGRSRVRLRFSGEIHYRTVYEDSDGRTWIDFYDQKVEVDQTMWGDYRTVCLY